MRTATPEERKYLTSSADESWGRFFLADWGGGHINFCIEAFKDGSAITCNFTDCTRGSDQTCIVLPGEHPEIKKKSVVNYGKAHHCEEGLPFESLLRLIESYKDPLSTQLLARIKQGAFDSPRTADVIKAALWAKV